MKTDTSMVSFKENDQQNNNASTGTENTPGTTSNATANGETPRTTNPANRRNKNRKERRPEPKILKSPLLRLNDPLDLSRNIST